MTDMEDRSRRNNVRLVGLPEGAEGSNAAGFLRVNLSKWIPSLKGHDIEIDRAHHVYDGGKGSDRSSLHVLRWSGLVTNHHYFLLLNLTYVLGNVRSELFLVYGCWLFMFLCCFFFYNRYLYFYLFYPISKRIFHLGGLVSKMHISVYMLFTEWKCFCFFHL